MKYHRRTGIFVALFVYFNVYFFVGYLRRLSPLTKSVEKVVATRNSTAAATHPKQESNLVRGMSFPDVIVAGIGDSGTRGVHSYLNAVGGVHMCDNQTSAVKDCIPTKLCHSRTVLKKIFDNQSSRPVQLSALQQSGPREFEQLVQCQRVQAKTVLDGIRGHARSQNVSSENMFWGWKNPRHAYIVPVIQQAFGNNTAIVVVARHPYDLCSGGNQGQYRGFRRWMTHHTSNETSCMEFWAVVMEQLLTMAEAHPQTIRILRVESLVLGDEIERTRTGRCVANLVGYPYQHELNLRVTAGMGKYAISYGGASRVQQGNQTKSEWEAKLRLWKESVRNTTLEMEHIARRMGYSLSAYGKWTRAAEFLLAPTSSIVC